MQEERRERDLSDWLKRQIAEMERRRAAEAQAMIEYIASRWRVGPARCNPQVHAGSFEQAKEGQKHDKS